MKLKLQQNRVLWLCLAGSFKSERKNFVTHESRKIYDLPNYCNLIKLLLSSQNKRYDLYEGYRQPICSLNCLFWMLIHVFFFNLISKVRRFFSNVIRCTLFIGHTISYTFRLTDGMLICKTIQKTTQWFLRNKSSIHTNRSKQMWLSQTGTYNME